MQIDILGIEWYVEVRGETGPSGLGEPILFLHGFSQDSSTWHPVLDHLPAHLTSVLVDLPGHGRSAKPRTADAYRMDRLAHSLDTLRMELGIERWRVVGYSMGGRIALTYALRHPERVASLVLESASFGPADAQAREEALRVDEALVKRLRGSSPAEFAEWWPRTAVLASQHELPEAVRAAEARVRAANDPETLACVVLGAGQGQMRSLFEDASRLPMRIRYLVGSKDGKYLALAQQAHEAWGLDVTQLQSGHNVHLEQPSEYAAALLQFFRDDDEEL